MTVFSCSAQHQMIVNEVNNTTPLLHTKLWSACSQQTLCVCVCVCARARAPVCQDVAIHMIIYKISFKAFSPCIIKDKDWNLHTRTNTHKHVRSSCTGGHQGVTTPGETLCPYRKAILQHWQGAAWLIHRWHHVYIKPWQDTITISVSVSVWVSVYSH